MAGRTAYTRLCVPLYQRHAPPVDEAAFRARYTPDVTAHFITGERRTFDLRAELARVACPVLVMNGAHDPITTVEDAEDVVAALPAHLVRFERFDDCGHSLLRDDPTRALASIRSVLASVAL